MKYRHLFFDLDHTLWDFNENARLTLIELYHELALEKAGVANFDHFLKVYLGHNEQLWEKYRSGTLKAENCGGEGCGTRLPILVFTMKSWRAV
jgi:putative hydrolase of the HAD superfamily